MKGIKAFVLLALPDTGVVLQLLTLTFPPCYWQSN